MGVFRLFQRRAVFSLGMGVVEQNGTFWNTFSGVLWKIA
jgi:hypothetical protein